MNAFNPNMTQTTLSPLLDASRYIEAANMCGLIPWMVDADNTVDAVEQIHANYSHGGGWCDQDGFIMAKTPMLVSGLPVWVGAFIVETEVSTTFEALNLCYEGEEPLLGIGYIEMKNGQRVVIFDYGYVAVIEKSGSFRVARID